MSGRNMLILGAGSISGGSYHKVRCMGAGEMSGEVEAKKVSAAGAFKASGSLKTGRLSAHGASEFEELTADDVHLNGASSIHGSAAVQRLKARGASEFHQNVSGSTIHIRGAADFHKDVQAEQLFVSGIVKIQGMLNANEVRIYFKKGESSLHEVGASKIHFAPRSSIFDRSPQKPHLTVQVLEADSIYVENTTADTIRGESIALGPDCRVGTVEYQKEIHIDKNSRVKNKIKISGRLQK